MTISTPRSRRLVAFAVAGALVLAACSDDDDDEAATTEPVATESENDPVAETEVQQFSGDPFVVGFLDPGPGLLSDLAGAQALALQLAIEDINATGGVNGGATESVAVAEPPSGDVSSSVQELVDDGAHVVLGPVGSTGAGQVIPGLGDVGTVSCSASATAPELQSLDGAGRFFRTVLPDDLTAPIVADHLDQLRSDGDLPEDRPPRIAVVARQDDYGIAVGNGLASVLTAREYEVDVVGYNPRRVLFTGETARVTDLQPDLVVLVSYEEAVPLTSTLLDAGVAPSSILGLDAQLNPRLAEQVEPDDPAAVDGFRVYAATGGRAFLDRVVERLDSQRQIAFAPQAYDCVIAAALAATAAGSSHPADVAEHLAVVTNGSRACSTYADCVEQLNAGETISYQGAIGNLAFDDEGEVSAARYSSIVVAEGALSEVSSVDIDLAELRQQEAVANAVFVSRLQQALTLLGFYEGPIDGVYSDDVSTAVAALQVSLGLEPTGVYDEATDAALRARLGDASALLDSSIRGLQEALTELGLYEGPIDGWYNAETVEAVRALQRQLGVPETGVIDAATLQAAFERGIAIGSESSVTTEPPATAPPATEPPATAPSVTEPPATAPSVTEPPATKPPVTQPPPTEPPVTQPPVTEPPATIAPPETVPSTTIPPDQPTLADQLRDDGRFTVLLELLEAAGYTGEVAVEGPLTVFAPTDEAFERELTAEDLEGLKVDPEALDAVLTVHVVEDRLDRGELVTGELTTVHGQVVAIVNDGTTITVDDIEILEPQLDASNGVIHPIDGVLLPTA